MTSPVRTVAAVLVALAACFVPATTVPADVNAGEPTTTAPTTDATPGEAPESPAIIPRPGRGSEPQDAGDRGGALQSVVFGLIVLGLVGMGALVVRESRRAQSRKRSQEP